MGAEPSSEEKYFLELHKQRAHNHYISRFLGDGSHKGVSLELPAHPLRRAK